MKRRLLLAATVARPALARADDVALVAAAEAGDLATLRRLLDAGTPVDVRDARRRTAPLAHAQQRGQKAIVEILRRAGARA